MIHGAAWRPHDSSFCWLTDRSDIEVHVAECLEVPLGASLLLLLLQLCTTYFYPVFGVQHVPLHRLKLLNPATAHSQTLLISFRLLPSPAERAVPTTESGGAAPTTAGAGAGAGAAARAPARPAPVSPPAAELSFAIGDRVFCGPSDTRGMDVVVAVFGSSPQV